MEDPLLGPEARPSDEDAAVTATGTGDVSAAVFYLAPRTRDGSDEAVMRWHHLDHLPEQYRIVGVRNGQRFVSTPACHAARAAAAGLFEGCVHLVNYLFAEPVDAALDNFSELGATLFAAGRMPGSRLPGTPRGTEPRSQVSPAPGSQPGPEPGSQAVPQPGSEPVPRPGAKRARRAHVGVYDLVATRAARAALVGAAVIPWRPARGVYLLVERVAVGAEDGAGLDQLADTPGVAGLWRYRGSRRHADHYGDHTDHTISVFYLDQDPVTVARELGPALASRWAGSAVEPLLAAPFETVVPWQWERTLP